MSDSDMKTGGTAKAEGSVSGTVPQDLTSPAPQRNAARRTNKPRLAFHTYGWLNARPAQSLAPAYFHVLPAHMNPVILSALITMCVAIPPAAERAEVAPGKTPPARTKPANDDAEKATASTAVYAKIILPVEKAADGGHPVEPWIAKALTTRGKAHVRAVSGWVRLSEKGSDKENTTIWNGVLDDKQWGCPAWGQVIRRTADGSVKVKIDGFLPVVPAVKGGTLAAKPGSTAIAEVEHGRAYVALRIGPPEEPGK